jgi:hypothetical protein
MSERNERKRKIPTHPGFPIFVRHTEDVMKNILDLPLSLNPPALIILHCVCVCLRVCVCRREGKMWMEMPQTYFFYFYFMFSVYAIRSFADRLPIVRRGGAALNRTRHEDGTLTTPFGRREGGQLLPSAPDPTPRKKRE